METQKNTAQHDLPEAILTEIVAMLPLRSISRFKSVCRTWKSATESVYFRRLFVSLHQNTSSSWSLMLPGAELIHFHKCQKWGLPKSLGSYMQNMKICDKFSYVDSSNGLVLMKGVYGASYVGNLVLKQWVEIPSAPCPCVTMLSGLVTRVDDHDGVLLSFKVVRTVTIIPSKDRSSTCLCFYVLLPWMESLPHPPQVEMIDTTSLLSSIIASKPYKKRCI